MDFVVFKIKFSKVGIQYPINAKIRHQKENTSYVENLAKSAS